MPKTVLTDMDEKMKKSVDVVRHELTGVRTGRASATLLETVRVDYYGVPTPVTQVASVSVPESRMIVLQPLPQYARPHREGDYEVRPRADPVE